LFFFFLFCPVLFCFLVYCTVLCCAADSLGHDDETRRGDKTRGSRQEISIRLVKMPEYRKKSSVLVAALAKQESPAGVVNGLWRPVAAVPKTKGEGGWSTFVVTALDKQNNNKGGTKEEGKQQS
jgi:hypothetical protein